MEQKIYAIQFTEAGLHYVRRALGMLAYDEAGPLIVNIEQQRAEQDKPAPPVEVPPTAEPAVKRARARKPAALNGSGSALHQTQ